MKTRWQKLYEKVVVLEDMQRNPQSLAEVVSLGSFKRTKLPQHGLVSFVQLDSPLIPQAQDVYHALKVNIRMKTCWHKLYVKLVVLEDMQQNPRSLAEIV